MSQVPTALDDEYAPLVAIQHLPDGSVRASIDVAGLTATAASDVEAIAALSQLIADTPASHAAIREKQLAVLTSMPARPLEQTASRMALHRAASPETYDAVIASAPVVIVEFWAPSCGPCAAMASVVDGVLARLDEPVEFVQVNAEACLDFCRQRGLLGTPMFIVYRDGQERGRLLGARGAAVLERELRVLIAPAASASEREQPR